MSRSQLLARISATLGGRVAEEVIFGDTEVTTGASQDIQVITNMARQMVTRLGMSELGPIALEEEQDRAYDWLGGRRSEYSEEISARIDAQVRSIINKCYGVAKEIIEENRPIIDRLVDILIEQETIEGDEFRRILNEYTQSSNKQLAVSH